MIFRPGDTLTVPPDAAGRRLDQYLAEAMAVSRARAHLLLTQSGVVVNGQPDTKPSHKLRGGETLAILAAPEPPPLRAVPEAIPLTILYEDGDLAVIDKPAGMMVHAGAAPPALGQDTPRSSGTLVNALLHHMRALSTGSAPLRPGIVHRLDKETSGLILVAKNDEAHQRLSEFFARRQVRKTYLALVHGILQPPSGTVSAPIARDAVRRTRMTTRREGGRSAVTHYRTLTAFQGPYGAFSYVEVRIETGRTHQIRVHLASLGHPVVGDRLYGAPAEIRPLAAPFTQNARRKATLPGAPSLALPRNFLHAAQLALAHPRTGLPLAFTAPLPPQLLAFLSAIQAPPTARGHAIP